MSLRMWSSRWHNPPSCRRDRIPSSQRLSKPMARWSAALSRMCLVPSRWSGRLATGTGPDVVRSGILWSLFAVAFRAWQKWVNQLLAFTPKSVRLLLRTAERSLPRSNSDRTYQGPPYSGPMARDFARGGAVRTGNTTRQTRNLDIANYATISSSGNSVTFETQRLIPASEKPSVSFSLSQQNVVSK